MIGLGTYIDPRHQGGKLTDRAKQDLVRLIRIDNKEYLFYPRWPLEVGFIRATMTDEFGNLSCEDEPISSSSLAMALAIKGSGTVIAQVKRLIELGRRDVQHIKVPGMLVDRVVVAPRQMMSTDIHFDPAFLGGTEFEPSRLPRLSMGPEKVIARRASREIRPGVISIFGFGASSDIPLAMAEEGRFEQGKILDYHFTTEHGTFGGLVMSGWQFSANLYAEALLDGVYHFDFMDGGNCEFAALAFAQLDSDGNVNVSRFGSFNQGAGGFIDIASHARELVLTGTFTTGGLKVDIGNGGLRVLFEGKNRKFVQAVEQITYPVRNGVAQRGQRAKVITERAVFQVEPDGLVLTEIAKGVDLHNDVLAQMEFQPKRIATPLPLMEEALFT